MVDLQHPSRFAAVAPDRPAVITSGCGDVLTYGELEDRSCRVANAPARPSAATRARTSRCCWRTGPSIFEVAVGRAARRPARHPHQLAPRRPTRPRYIVEDCGASVLVASAALRPTSCELADAAATSRARSPSAATLPGFDDYEEALAGQPATPPTTSARAPGCSTRRARPGGPRASSRRRSASPSGRRRRSSMLVQGLYGGGEDTVYLQPGAAVPRRSGGLDHRDAPPRRHHGGHGPLRPARGARADRGAPGDPRAVRADPPRAAAEAARRGAGALRPVEPAGRRARRRALPARGQAGGARVAGADRARVLLGQRGRRVLRHRPRGVARPPRLGRAGRCSARCTSSAPTAPSCRPARRARSGSSARPLRVPRRPGQDGRGHRRAGLGHARRHRPGRRRGLPLPDRPGVEHDHLGRRQHLPPRGRGRAGRCTPRSPTSPSSACPTPTWARRCGPSCSSPPGSRPTTRSADGARSRSAATASPHFKCPRSVVFVDELPRLPTGKLAKRLLPASVRGLGVATDWLAILRVRRGCGDGASGGSGQGAGRTTRLTRPAGEPEPPLDVVEPARLDRGAQALQAEARHLGGLAAGACPGRCRGCGW